MWWTLAALATDGFTEVRRARDCVYEQRDRAHAQGSAMRATCVWPEVDPEGLRRTLSDFEAYDRHIFVIDASEIRRPGDRALVYQLQRMWPLSDREVLLWAWTEPLADGARYRWETAAGEPLTLSRGAIRTPRNVGYWEVRDRPGGGSLVTHQIAVDAGGTPLPGWLLRWVRNRGFQRVMDEMREGHER